MKCVAYSDESQYNEGQYRSLAAVSLPEKNKKEIADKLGAMLDESNVSEFKWSKLNDAKYRFAAKKISRYVISKAREGKMRLDVLAWDIEDDRHAVVGRDDNENLGRMYYHLFNNIMKNRWPDKAEWKLYPDEHGAMDWETLLDVLKNVAIEIQKGNGEDLFVRRDDWGIRERFNIEKISPSDSEQEELIQVTDLFAGLMIYSRRDYKKYKSWETHEANQHSMFENQKMNLSKREEERAVVLKQVNDLCKKNKLSVSLESKKRLKTYGPDNPINFWWYESQHEMDTAPVRRGD